MQHHSLTLLSVTSVHLQPVCAHPADGVCVCMCVRAGDVGLYGWVHTQQSVCLCATIVT